MVRNIVPRIVNKKQKVVIINLNKFLVIINLKIIKWRMADILSIKKFEFWLKIILNRLNPKQT